MRTKMPERSQGIFPVTDGTIFMDTAAGRAKMERAVGKDSVIRITTALP